MQAIYATDDAQLEVRDIAAPEEPPSGSRPDRNRSSSHRSRRQALSLSTFIAGGIPEADTVFGQPPPLAQSSPLLRMFQSSMQAGRSRSIGL